MTVFGIFEIGPLESCGNEFQSTGSHRLTVCTSTDSYYYISAYTWGQKRNSFPQGSSGPIFKFQNIWSPMNPQNQLLSEQNFFGTFCVWTLTLLHMQSSDFKDTKLEIYFTEVIIFIHVKIFMMQWIVWSTRITLVF